MRSSFAFAVGALVLMTPAIALAQGECPDGSWFCEEPSTPPQADDESAPDTDEGSTAEPSSPDTKTKPTSPPVVVYQPSNRDVVVDRSSVRAHKRYKREWGFNLRLESAMLGSDEKRHPDSGMSGLGFSFRYRPIGHFAFDVGVDLLGGTDWQGNRRGESALLLNAMVFFNPRSKLQVYTLGGIGFSGARVERPSTLTMSDGTQVERTTTENWSYFGGQLGLGLEWRVSRKVALDLDVLGFIRGRTDDQARLEPEFIDPDTHQATNTSGGGLGRLGITFYW